MLNVSRCRCWLLILGVFNSVVMITPDIKAAPATSQIIVSTGTTAPDGIGAFSTLPHLSAPVLNDLGQLSFRANLTGDGIDSTNEQGLSISTATPWSHFFSPAKAHLTAWAHLQVSSLALF